MQSEKHHYLDHAFQTLEIPPVLDGEGGVEKPHLSEEQIPIKMKTN